MKLKAFSIHDSKAKVFSPPFYMTTHGEAERSLKSTINKPSEANIHKYPEDFSMHEVGEFDDQTGIFTGHEPRHLVNAIQLKD